jgi:chromosome segregation ATPase
MTSPLPSPNHARASKAASTIKAVQELLLNPEIQDFVALEDRNTQLSKANKTLEADVESRDRRIAFLMSEADKNKNQADSMDAQLDKLEKDKTALSSKLAAAHAELKETHQKMANRDAQRVKELEEIKKKLQTESDKLRRLRGFSVGLVPLATSQEEM